MTPPTPQDAKEKLLKEFRERILQWYEVKKYCEAYEEATDLKEVEERWSAIESFFLTAMEEVEKAAQPDLEKVLTDYSDWLHKRGYIDADYYTEEPKAIDAYLKTLNERN